MCITIAVCFCNNRDIKKYQTYPNSRSLSLFLNACLICLICLVALLYCTLLNIRGMVLRCIHFASQFCYNAGGSLETNTSIRGEAKFGSAPDVRLTVSY